MISPPPDGLPEKILATTDTGYVRFYGKNEWYRHDYSNEELTTWQQKLKELKARRLYMYFNNDADGHAVKNAQNMKSGKLL